MNTPPTDSTARTDLPRWLIPVAVVALTALGLGIRLVRLSDIGLWYDEAFGLLIARMPWAQMNDTLALDVHPPLWFYLIHFWGTDSILWARMFGVLLGTATIPALWCLLRRPLGQPAALIAALVLAVYPVHVFYSQELRMYALQGLLITGMLSVAIRIASGASCPRWWLGLALLAWAVMATQYLSGSVVAGVWIGLLIARFRSANRQWWLGWAFSAVAALGGVAPFLLGAEWNMVEERGSGLPLSIHILRDVLEGTQGLIRMAPWEWLGVQAGSRMWDRVFGGLLLVLVVSGSRVLITDPKRRGAGIVLASMFGVGLVMLILYQAAGFLFFTRFYVTLLIPGIVLIAAVLSDGPRWWRWVGTMVVAASLLSTSAALVRANGNIREVSTKLARWIDVRGGEERMEPMFCTDVMIAMAMRAIYPNAELRVRAADNTPGQRAILGNEAFVTEWPQSWRGQPAWLLLSGWGNPPTSQEDLSNRCRAVALDQNSGASRVQVLDFEAIAGGFKWAAIAEVR